MSENESETGWNQMLERASAIDDADMRYALCERFLGRALMRIAAHSFFFDALATLWFEPIRRDGECAAVARRLLEGLSYDTASRHIVSIIAHMDADVDPGSVGYVCACHAYGVTEDVMRARHASVAKQTHVPTGQGAAIRAAEIARDDEQRLQIMDVQEHLALLARARGEEVEA